VRNARFWRELETSPGTRPRHDEGTGNAPVGSCGGACGVLECLKLGNSASCFRITPRRRHRPPQRSTATMLRRWEWVIVLRLERKSGRALGGLWGRTELGLLFLDMFFVPGHLRGRLHGTQLLALVEGEARRRGCRRAVVETSSFQAPGFYSSHGYEEFGRVEFAVEGQARIFLRKRLE